jgi:hypothetical protein
MKVSISSKSSFFVWYTLVAFAIRLCELFTLWITLASTTHLRAIQRLVPNHTKFNHLVSNYFQLSTSNNDFKKSLHKNVNDWALKIQNLKIFSEHQLKLLCRLCVSHLSNSQKSSVLLTPMRSDFIISSKSSPVVFWFKISLLPS